MVGVLRASHTANAPPSVDDSPENRTDKEVKLWGGRFEESVTDAVERFTESISYDKQLYKHDIRGSRAHATMLAKQVRFDFSISLNKQNLIRFSPFESSISFDFTKQSCRRTEMNSFRHF